MSEFAMKTDDTHPVIRVQITDLDDTPLDLTLATTVLFKMKATLADASPLISVPATIVDPLNGIVEYEWQPGDNSNAGEYIAEWECTFSDGRVITAPTENQQAVRFFQDLD